VDSLSTGNYNLSKSNASFDRIRAYLMSVLCVVIRFLSVVPANITRSIHFYRDAILQPKAISATTFTLEEKESTDFGSFCGPGCLRCSRRS